MQSLPQRLLKQMQRGFTLIELLIVVIILAILAAIVIPQFTSATTDAQESALDADLANLRSAIELYRVQHANQYPGAVAATSATCANGGAPGTGAAGENAALISQLTMFSNPSGGTCNLSVGTTTLGPYLRKGFPAEPITSNATIAVATGAAASLPLAPAAATGGWAYSTVTGQIVMNSNAKDSKGVNAYSTH